MLVETLMGYLFDHGASVDGQTDSHRDYRCDGCGRWVITMFGELVFPYRGHMYCSRHCVNHYGKGVCMCNEKEDKSELKTREGVNPKMFPQDTELDRDKTVHVFVIMTDDGKYHNTNRNDEHTVLPKKVYAALKMITSRKVAYYEEPGKCDCGLVEGELLYSNGTIESIRLELEDERTFREEEET